MAKPSFASPVASSSSPRRPRASHPNSSRLPNRSPRSRPVPSRTRTLALLAVSAAPLFALAHPLDPPQTSLPFLYPPFVLQPTVTFAKRSTTPSTSVVAAITCALSTHSSRCQYARRDLPDKYALADDGLYHKTPWSLYGSCAGSCPTSSMTGDTADDVSGSGGPESLSLPPYDEFDASSLPTGWTSITIDATSHRGAAVVLTLSVALALVIIVLMFAFIFWRRKLFPKRDPEKRRRKSSDRADDISIRSIREAKTAQRKWGKATTRWLDNVRVSAHRRRTNRALAPTTSHPTLPLEGVDVRSPLSRSRPSSPTLTQRSVTPIPDIRSSSVTSIHSSHTQTPRVLTDVPIPPSSPPPTQPPAYDPPSSPPESHVPLESTHSDCSPSGVSKAPLSPHTQSQPCGDDDGHLTSLSGHVATDDKATLTLRATLASAPSGSSSNFPESVSVPSMEDVDTFEWPSGSPPSPSLDEYRYEPHPPYSPPTSLLPPPPSKGKQRFDYSYDLDVSVNLDSAIFEPQLAPSAPPFEDCEAVPSAPPFDLDVHVPSAPPMDSED